jgi:hypothetical protein
MKKRIHRILGVTLSLVMVFSLAIALLPTSAAAEDEENLWQEFAVPKSGNSKGWVLAPGHDHMKIGPIAMAIDGTLYMFAQPADTDYTLFKSTDGGREWSYIGKVKKDDIVDIACSPEDADVLYYCTTDDVYKSSNGGGKWTEMLDITIGGGDADWDSANGETITDLDVNLIGDEHVVIVSTIAGTEIDEFTGHIWVFDEGVRITPSWVSQDVGDYDVWAVSAFPDFPTTKGILAVVSAYSGGVAQTWVTAKKGAAGWNTELGNAELQPGNDENANLTCTRADIAFPADWEGDPSDGFANCYIGVSDNVVDNDDADGGGVYEFIGISGANKSVTLDLGVGEDVWSLAVNGDEGDCDIIAGTRQDAGGEKDVIRESTDGGDTWKSAKKEPSGEETPGYSFLTISGTEYTQPYVVMLDDYEDTGAALVALGGKDGAVSLRTSSRIYNGISMINGTIDEIKDLAIGLGSEVIYMTTFNYTKSYYAIWRNASNWERILTETLEDAQTYGADYSLLAITPEHQDDDTIFTADKGTENKILRSVDRGEYWKPQVRAPDLTIRGFTAPDKNTVVVGSDGETQKTTNNGKSWKTSVGLTGAGSCEHFAQSPFIGDDDTLLVGTDAGEVWRSTDTGGSWSQLKSSHSGMASGYPVWPGFDYGYDTNNTMYCTSAYGGVYRYIKGDSSSWARMDTVDGCSDNSGAYMVYQGRGIVTAPNALYVTDSSAAGMGASRSVNPTASIVDGKVFFDIANQTIEGDLTKKLTGLWKTPGSNTKIWSIFDSKKLYYLVDTLVKKVITTAPDCGEQSGRVDQVEVVWDKLDKAKKYQLWVNTRSDFKGQNVLYSEDGGIVKTKGLNWVVNIADKFTGIKLYWRVRVLECEPYRSLYSETCNFTTELKGAQWNPFKTVEGNPGNVAPLAGATGVAKMPTFQWNSAEWATGYELIISYNADFSSPIKSVKVADAVWACDVELEEGKIVYWKVRAVSDLSESEWAVGTFTVMVTPDDPPPPVTVAPPTAPVVIPPAPAPIAPVYIWVIIIIGAILVIAVIVLIVSTRKHTG